MSSIIADAKKAYTRQFGYVTPMPNVDLMRLHFQSFNMLEKTRSETVSDLAMAIFEHDEKTIVEAIACYNLPLRIFADKIKTDKYLEQWMTLNVSILRAKLEFENA